MNQLPPSAHSAHLTAGARKPCAPSFGATRIRILRFLLLIIATFSLEPASAQRQTVDEATAANRIELGRLMFEELRFSDPGADYGASCGGCHVNGEKIGGRPPRIFADYGPRSLTAGKKTTRRNTPTLRDASEMTALGWAGAHSSLENLIAGKLTSELMGWRASDDRRAHETIHLTLLIEYPNASNKSYLELFKEAYGVDLEAVEAEEAVGWATRGIAHYTRSLRSTRTAPWDAFVTQNRFRDGPNQDEDATHYSFGVFSRIGNQEGRKLIKRPQGFTRNAYLGFKIFFRIEGTEGEAVGNCVACHTPPLFTDFTFHNAGIAELAYDSIHGDGASTGYRIPDIPSEKTRSQPHLEDSDRIDLGRFNVDGKESSAGAFKTPSLRNLAGTDPYMHNGAYSTLEEAVQAKVKTAARGHAGELPRLDPAYSKMRLSEQDIVALVAFLKQLNEVEKQDFRNYLIKLERD